MTDHIKCSFRRLCGRNTWDELQTPAQRLYYKTQALHEYCGPHLQQTIDILILPRTYHSQGLITLQWYRHVMAVTQPYQWNHEYNITQPHRREQILSLSCFLFSFSILGFLRNKTHVNEANLQVRMLELSSWNCDRYCRMTCFVFLNQHCLTQKMAKESPRVKSCDVFRIRLCMPLYASKN